jgi:hypothetical protein
MMYQNAGKVLAESRCVHQYSAFHTAVDSYNSAQQALSCARCVLRR